MPVLKYEELTHVDVQSFDKKKSVIFLPVAPLEEHAPHLPLGVDAMTSTHFSFAAAERMLGRFSDWNFIVLPTFFAGSDTLIYPGSIEVSPKILRALLYQTCRALAKDGFKNIVAIGAHGGPRHMVVLEELAEKMKWRHKVRMISASSRILVDILEGKFISKIDEDLQKSGHSLSAEEKEALKTDYHAGMLETSIMLHIRPDLVKESYKRLEPAIVSNYWKLKRTSGKKVGAGLGHLGSPALARKEIGESAIRVFLDTLDPLLVRFLNGENVGKYFRSKLYYIPFFRTDFPLLMLMVAYIGILGLTVWFLNHLVMGFSK